MNLEELEKAAQEAQAALEALRAELGRMPRALQLASNEGDGAGLLRLVQRQKDLPTLIFAAEITEKRAQIGVLDAEIAENKTGKAALLDAVKAAEAAQKEAAERVRAAWAAHGRHDSIRQSLVEQRNRLSREIEDRIVEQSQLKQARPVHSLQHMA